ncbi:hypothetical protein [Microseira wollei]|uniref:Uncharacterized protein n=1 Tax=Microseira wollei NIES-4236 TaxID=2530354 RepID=A0AAV3XDS6_9CYAN|nr:hypothetical protein [Microseira wollei]GET38831.1 hypothetical protein MiSe_35900 [Microseira wollei NIES-4236]
MRQFLFILPGIAAISARSISWLWKKYFMGFFGVGLMAILCLHICFDMINLHPYEYIYFNRLSGGLIGAYNRYETEYWGLSLREAMEWVNKNSKMGKQVLVAGPLDSAKLFAKPGSDVIEVKKSNIAKPYYYLGVPRWNLEKAFPECQEVYKVVRQGVPLTTVKRCE